MINHKLAYLASEYPGISHTFIYREVQFLRKFGVEVKTISIRKPENLDKLTTPEQNEANETLYIKKQSLSKIIKSHISIFLKSPHYYLGMLKYTASITLKNRLKIVKVIAYFIEAGIIVNWMNKEKIKHTHVHFANPAATAMMIAACYKNISYSMSVHGPDIFYNVDANLLTEKIIKAEFVRCISYYCQSQIMRLVPYNYWNNLRIIQCGIDPTVYTPRPEPMNNKTELLCVGRLVSAKGQHILLQACSLLNDYCVDFHLTFVGDGEDRDTLELIANELEIRENITFTGSIGQDDVLPYYEKANIFVLASFAEGVPVVLMEAMAKEIPCVSTRITGIPELIENNVDGILVDSSNVHDLAQKLKELIKDPDKRRKLGINGRKKVLANYDLNNNCKILVNLFGTYV